MMPSTWNGSNGLPNKEVADRPSEVPIGGQEHPFSVLTSPPSWWKFA